MKDDFIRCRIDNVFLLNFKYINPLSLAFNVSNKKSADNLDNALHVMSRVSLAVFKILS